MPTVPLHPAIVHVPLGLAFVLPLLSIGLALALWRGLLARRAWIVAVALQGVLVAAGAGALWSGERDESNVERITGGQAIERHEEAAQAFVWGAAIVLAVGAAALVVPARAAAVAAAIAAAGTLAVAGLGYRAGRAGGELVYARGGAAAYAANAARAVAPASDAPALARKRHHR